MLKEKIKNLAYYKKAKAWYVKHERLLLPLTLLFGFLTDLFTFKTLDISLAFSILTGHIIFAGLVVAFMQIYDARLSHFQGRRLSYIRLFCPIALQFSFGALLSASFIFYTFGGVFAVSWPLFLLLLFLMISNELFKKKYEQSSVLIPLYYFLLLMFLTLVFPYIFRSISFWYYLLAGLVSLGIIILFVRGLSFVAPDIKRSWNFLFKRIAVIFLLMHGLYVFNIIPPVPLSLRDAGVYHQVKRDGSTYELLAEKQSLAQKIIPGERVHIQEGDNVYVFTSIFAPSRLHTTIIHHWQHFDEQKDSWMTKSRLSYSISGGRQDGYRGYTLRPTTRPGKYRVLVETPKGQVLGKVAFRVIFSEQQKSTHTLFSR